MIGRGSLQAVPHFKGAHYCFRWLPKMAEKVCKTTRRSFPTHKTFRRSVERILPVNIKLKRLFKRKNISQRQAILNMFAYTTVRQYSRNDVHLIVHPLFNTHSAFAAHGNPPQLSGESLLNLLCHFRTRAGAAIQRAQKATGGARLESRN